MVAVFRAAKRGSTGIGIAAIAPVGRVSVLALVRRGMPISVESGSHPRSDRLASEVNSLRGQQLARLHGEDFRPCGGSAAAGSPPAGHRPPGGGWEAGD